MQLVPVENIGMMGLNTDVPSWQLPPNVWSESNNVRFDDLSVRKSQGLAKVFDQIPLIHPMHLETYQSGNDSGTWWIAFGTQSIMIWDGSTWKDLTPSTKPTDMPIDSPGQWQTTKLGSLVYATNGIDPPYYWDGKLENKFKPLPNWTSQTDPHPPSPHKYGAVQTLAGFKSFLWAGNVYVDTDDVGTQPKKVFERSVYWSNMTNFYTAPEWDIALESDAGHYELLDSMGGVVHLQQLRESMMIYKSDSVLVSTFIGAPFMFTFQTIAPEIGVLCKNAVADFPGGHWFVGRSDCYINNGQTIETKLTNRVQSEMFKDIDGDYAVNTYCVTDWANNEIWTCYPSVGNSRPNRALIWNYKNDTFSFRDLFEKTGHIKYGVAPVQSGVQWGGDQAADTGPTEEGPFSDNYYTGEWDSSTDSWGTQSYDDTVEHLVWTDSRSTNSARQLYRHESGNLLMDAPMDTKIERTGIDLGDPSTVKYVSAVYPKMWTSTADATFNVWTAHQMNTEDAVTWEGPKVFNPETMNKISVRTSGKFFGIRMESNGDFDWLLSGLEWETATSGRRGSRVYT